mmetsp:Transcript_26668/g.48007  ORF Transcript_26668/g.48007 Transcript_26668/m.48007 type:complete len:704 (-) Transcript_26668:3043-5154(-)
MESYSEIDLYNCSNFVILVGRIKLAKTFSLIRIMKNRDKPVIDELAFNIPTEAKDRLLFTNLTEMKAAEKIEALLGLTHFTQGHYLFVVTRKQKIAKIRSHSIYKIEETKLIKLFTTKSPKEEKRYREIFKEMNMSAGFYFSKSYDLTHTLQENISFQLNRHHGFGKESLRVKLREDYEVKDNIAWKPIYLWNHAHLNEVSQNLTDRRWLTPLIHGYVGYCRLEMLGKLFDLVLISRRSRFFAGTRYLKRGVSEDGKVANDVETEQILVDNSSPRGSFSSYVQIRGSVPLFWCQEPNSLLARPPIIFNKEDLLCEATRKHFSDLFIRYGVPVICLSLLKVNGHSERELAMSQEFRRALLFLNERMDQKYHIDFMSIDMKHEKKSRSQLGFIDLMHETAEGIIDKTSLFVVEQRKSGMVHCSYQVGVVRTNCIDCIDRTNGAQMLISNKALERQLMSMGLILNLEKDCELYQVLNNMWEEMGDELALQYSGSAAHKQISRSRGRKAIEIMTSIKRHWSNIVTDSRKQQSINLFLGVFDPRKQRTPLWEVDDDSYLHVHHIEVSSSPSHSWAQFALKRFQHRLKLHLFNDDGVRRQKHSQTVYPFQQKLRSTLKFKERNRMSYSNRDLMLYFPCMTSMTIMSKKLAQPTYQTHKISIDFTPNFSSASRDNSEAKEAESGRGLDRSGPRPGVFWAEGLSAREDAAD